MTGVVEIKTSRGKSEIKISDQKVAHIYSGARTNLVLIVGNIENGVSVLDDSGIALVITPNDKPEEYIFPDKTVVVRAV